MNTDDEDKLKKIHGSVFASPSKYHSVHTGKAYSPVWDLWFESVPLVYGGNSKVRGICEFRQDVERSQFLDSVQKHVTLYSLRRSGSRFSWTFTCCSFE